MPKSSTLGLVGVAMAVLAGLAAWRIGWSGSGPAAAQLLQAADESRSYPALTILYPPEGTVFPPDIVPPVFRWEDGSGAEVWRVIVANPGEKQRRSFSAAKPEWSPNSGTWRNLQRSSQEKEAVIVVIGWRRSDPRSILSRGQVSIRTSRDEVNAPLFYREVPLPFLDTVKDPSRIRWRFGPISSPKPPPVVLEDMPVCGNCHSFPRDGRWLAMDVDCANSKGFYVITPVGREMALTPKEIIT